MPKPTPPINSPTLVTPAEVENRHDDDRPIEHEAVAVVD
jgi:hypothetical protein